LPFKCNLQRYKAAKTAEKVKTKTKASSSATASKVGLCKLNQVDP
jgi:hypothetical protein